MLGAVAVEVSETRPLPSRGSETTGKLRNQPATVKKVPTCSEGLRKHRDWGPEELRR